VTVPATGGHRGSATGVTGAVALVLTFMLAVLSGCTGAAPADSPPSASGEPPHPSSPPATAPAPASAAPAPAAPAPTSRVIGGEGSADDRLAADVVTGVEQFWREEFPAQFGRRWVSIERFVASDPRDAVNPPPCLRRSLDLFNQALYCPRLDTVAWDRVGLIPNLRANYGASAVIVALAHEIGHAVQSRLGIDASATQREPERYPTILLEGMADCYAGVVLHAVSDGRIPTLRTSPPDLDRALHALISFRDPVGAPVGSGAHGNAFDRAVALIDGYQGGARECASMMARPPRFTERGYRSMTDAARGGNLGLGPLLESVGPDARNWFGQLAAGRGHAWSAPVLSLARVEHQCGPTEVADQGPVRFCPATSAVTVSREQLASVHNQFGDYASAILVASRYALGALATLGKPVIGSGAGRTAVCLTGAYTGALLDRRDRLKRGGAFELSPGDLDEAVDELLAHNFAARDAAGRPPSDDLGFQRVQQFQVGVFGGPGACGV